MIGRAALAGLGIILAALILGALFPRTWWAQELVRAYTVRPSGPESSYRRRDFFRAAAWALLAAVGLLVLALLSYVIAARHPNLALENHLATAYGFTFFLLAAVALLGAIITAVRGLGRLPSSPHSQEPPEEAT